MTIPEAAKLGRPRFPEGESMSKVVVVRLKPEEFATVKKRADSEGLTISEFARDRLLSHGNISKRVLEHCKRLAKRAMDAETKLYAGTP